MKLSAEDLARLSKNIEENPDLAMVDRQGERKGSARTGRKVYRPSERDLQKSIFAAADLYAVEDPRWMLLYAVPNGQYRKGQRAEPGIRSGVPDIHLPVAGGQYHSLYIELKVGRNRLTLAQKWWQNALTEQGHMVVVIYDSVESAINVIKSYLADT